MKKFAATFVLLLILSFSVFAEGEYPIGGRNCPQGQTCRTGEIPISGKANESSDSSDKSVYLDVFDFITSIFG